MRISPRWIWNGLEPPFAGRVEVSAGRITSVERASPPAEASPTLLTVGLANAHVHLDLTFPRPEGARRKQFTEWLASVVERRRHEGSSGLTRAATAGICASLEGGVTLVFDDDPAGYSLAPLAESPIRRVVFREVIALTADGHDPGALREFLDGPVDSTRELRAIAPHAPYTVHPEVLPVLVAVANEARLPWSMHIAETEWERTLLEAGTGAGAEFIARFGADPAEFAGNGSAVARLDGVNLLSARALLVHGNHLGPDEIERIARAGAAVVYCPRSHQYFGHPPHPFARLLAAGIPVLFGTDGAISAGDLSLLEELRAAHRAHPSVPVEALWGAATRVPREFLGDRFGAGTIAPGEPADLALWRVPAGTDDPLRAVIRGGDALATWIDGDRVAGNDEAVVGPS